MKSTFLLLGALLFSSLATASISVSSLIGQNGVVVSKALSIKDPRHNFFAYCEPAEEGHRTYVCTIFLPTQKEVFFDLCDIESTAQGPELRCDGMM